MKISFIPATPETEGFQLYAHDPYFSGKTEPGLLHNNYTDLPEWKTLFAELRNKLRRYRSLLS